MDKKEDFSYMPNSDSATYLRSKRKKNAAYFEPGRYSTEHASTFVKGEGQ